MKCDDMLGILAASVHEPLPAAEKSALDAHLAGCGACRDTLAAWKKVAASLPAASLPDYAFFSSQRSAILDRIESPGRFAWRWAPLVAAGVLLTIVGVLVTPRRRVSDPAMMLNLDLIQNLDMAKDLTVLESMDQRDL